MTTRLAVGCPTFERAWCLPLWFDSLAAQKFPVDEIVLCFAYTKSFDGTFDVLENRGSHYSELRIYEYDLPTFQSRDLARLPMLAQLRNGFLEMVRETEADWFLSWDDDILYYPNQLEKLWKVASKDRAVGTLIDMGGNDEAMAHPSVMQFPQAMGELAFRRPYAEYDWSEPFKCDIIMAVKLMGKDVYQNTEYRWDPVGEDIGWCLSAEKGSYERWVQPDARGYHLYDKDISIDVLKTFPDLEYPDILRPLSRWYKPKDEWGH